MDFGLGTAKGGVGGLDANGNMNTVTQDPFVWAPMTEARSRYTGRAVVEAVAEAGEVKIAFLPVLGGKVRFIPTTGAEQELTVADGKVTVPGAGKIAYEYDNEIVPQDTLPTMIGQMKGITLQARARRIAIQYSQFAAFQS